MFFNNLFEQFEILLITPLTPVIIGDLDIFIANLTAASIFIAMPEGVDKRFKTFILFCILITLGVTVIVSQSPYAIIFAMAFLSLVPTLHFVRQLSLKKLSTISSDIISIILNILYFLGVLQYAYYFYNFLNNRLTLRQYKVYMIFVGTWFLSYVFFARYLLYLKVSNMPVSPVILIGYLIASLGLCLRLWTSFCWNAIPLIFYYYQDYSYLLMSPDEIGNSGNAAGQGGQAQGGSGGGNRFGGFMPRHNHNHNHFYPPIPPKSNFTHYFGFAVGGITVCGTIYACYTQNKLYKVAVRQLEETRRQADASEVAAKAAERQADAAEVTAGLMKPEEFSKKWKS